MSAAIAGVIGSVAVGALAAKKQGDAAKSAAKIQGRAAESGIAEERRQFDEIRKLLAPFITQGVAANDKRSAFLGLLGGDAERKAIAEIQGGSQFQTAAKEGETAILQNAAATGGLRGGNTQAALAKFRPNLLNQIIAQRVAGLGDVAGLGQASAAGQAAAGQNSSNAIAGLLQEQGAAQAGAALARGAAVGNFAGSVLGGIGTLYGQSLNRPGVVAPPASNAANVFNQSIAASNAAAGGAAPQYGTRGPI